MTLNRKYVRQKSERDREAEREMYRNPHGPHLVTPGPAAPAHVLEDRARRVLAVKSLTAEICGDPAPGQSALDKKRAAQCSATSTQAGSATIARTFALSQSGNALTNA